MSTDLTASSKKFVAKKALFSFLGRVFRIFGPEGNLRFYVKRKAFRLRDELNVYTDEQQSNVALVIKARSVFDFGTTYDVREPGGMEPIGAWRRQGLKSILRDEWTALGPGDVVLGKIQEDSMLMALFRRFFAHTLFPQTFGVYDGAEKRGLISQRFNPFQLTYDVDCTRVEGIDARLIVAGTILLLSIEGRQD